MDFKSGLGAVSLLEPWACCSTLAHPLPRPVDPKNRVLQTSASSAPLSRGHLCPSMLSTDSVFACFWRISVSHLIHPLKHSSSGNDHPHHGGKLCSWLVLRPTWEQRIEIFRLFLKCEMWLDVLIITLPRNQNTSAKSLRVCAGDYMRTQG